MSPLFMIRRVLQGDLCERNLWHGPHLKLSDVLYGRLKESDSNDSETSVKSILPLALLKQCISLRSVVASKSTKPRGVVLATSLVVVSEDKDRG